MATSYEGILRVDVEIRLNKRLTRGMVGVRATINSMQSRSGTTRVKLSEVSLSRTKGVDVEDGTWSGGTELSFGREGLSTGQEDAEASTLEEYATVLPFELSRRKRYTTEIVLVEDRAAGELDCFSAHIRLREPEKSEDKTEGAQLPKSKASVKKEVEECHRGGSTNREERNVDARQRILGPWAWQHHATVEVGLPCSYGGRALIVKGIEEVENAEANSKYQDKAEGQRPRNFIRPVSMGFSSR
ncbi:hypothetical protein GW17_00023191 [Ensete ventricosum]|nr:hypothetical protein GW17_00023191 [Ensete ventricosum]